MVDLAVLRAQVDDIGDAISHWSNPSMDEHQPTKDWPLASFSGALTTASTYFIAVMLLSTIVKSIYGPDEPKRSTVKATSLWQKLTNDPILFFLIIYNPMQVLLCGYMAYGVISEYIDKGYGIICNEFHPERTSLANVFWLFYVSKIFDYFDTLVIIIRRKWRQLSFLHVYHHITIFLYCWMALRSGWDGDVYFSTLFNCFIHMIMYSYYQCTALDIPVPKPIKMFVTKLQMIQFVSMNIQAVYVLIIRQDCPFPKNLAWVYLGYIFSLFVLFQDFSNKAYSEKSLEKKSKKQS